MWEAFFAFHICIAHCELLGCQVAQGAMWAHLVVIDPPAFNRLASVVQSEELVLVEAFLTEFAVEAFDIAVLDRATGSDEVRCDLVVVGPLIQCLRSELRSWSMTIRTGNPRCSRILSSTLTTRSAGRDVSTSMASISRV
jgi:hypothetical protein